MLININLILLFIFVDYTGIWNLWGENIYRRVLHHLQSNFDYQKEPFIKVLRQHLSTEDVVYLNTIIFNKTNGITNKSAFLSNLLGGHYSTKNTLYYDDFNNSVQKKFDLIGYKNIDKYEKFSNMTLKLGNSSFRGTILLYSGIQSKFGYHYDTEEPNCFRTIYLIRKEGKIPPFSYFNKKNQKKQITLEVGDGIFFRGTTTYHGIEKLNNNNSLRYVSGWQYCGIETIKIKSICSELRSASMILIFYTFFPLLFLVNISINLFNKMKHKKKNVNIYLWCIYASFINIYLYPIFISYIGSGRTTTISQIITFYFFCLLSNIYNYYDGMLLFNYIIFTEMFLKNKSFI